MYEVQYFNLASKYFDTWDSEFDMKDIESTSNCSSESHSSYMHYYKNWIFYSRRYTKLYLVHCSYIV